MKTLLLFFAAVTVVTAAPTTKFLKGDLELQRLILQEIIKDVNQVENNKQIYEISVLEAITTSHNPAENFCKAGKVLGKIKANDLGVTGEWLLPRRLAVYSRLQNVQCTAPNINDTVALHKLLMKIKKSAQLEYSQLKD